MNNDLMNRLLELIKEYKVTKLIQFGSSLESFDDSKDLDFACDGLYDKNFFRFGASLEKLFNKPVDLIPLQPANSFVNHIISTGKVIYESKIN
jgi:predicted nucleotidyltransferase